ncbi:MAG TPA: Uma2 family endonuclease [Armatimonadota bacterium]|nr:Uma2 family endonuclease [Armatimonadota bacterium]
MTIAAPVAPRDAVEVDERRYTVADFAELPSELPSGPVLYELDNGRLLSLMGTGDEHGAVVSNIGAALKYEGEQKGFGKARAGGLGIVLWRNPDRVVGADVAFIATRSLPIRRSREGYLETMPDLVVEVVSKNDTKPYVQRKVEDYLAAGVRVVWIADPPSRTVTVHRADAEPVVLGETDVLTLEGIIPGFQLSVEEAFRE